MKGVVQFGNKGKLNPRYVKPFEVTERVGLVAYRIALLQDLVGVHDILHISTLRKYVHNLLHVVNYGQLQI